MSGVIYTIRQAHAVIIERLGKFARVQTEGVSMRLPFVEKIRRVDDWGGVASKEGYLIELTEQHTDTQPRQCHTKDNVGVMSNASIYWRIVDPAKAVYEVDVLPAVIQDTALNALRSTIGAITLDEILRTRATLNERIAAQLSATAQKWGVLFTRVEIQELTTSDDTARAMQQQMEAERKSLAIQAEADGEAEADIRRLKAEREATIMRAEGQAEALSKISEAEAVYLERLIEKVGPDAASQILVAQKYISGMETISKNPADKVFLPNSFQGVFALDASKSSTGVREER